MDEHPKGQPSGPSPAVRLLAFYLPQFHEIPENNAWWGQGFTEWTNVQQAMPLFKGHQQPLAPSELGYYDLSSVEVLAQQAKLAQEHGIHGFCFYYYWFDGKRLLEKPVDMLLQAKHVKLPFCLCWANENWTKRWDGGEHEVLMKQSYSPALNEQFARDLLAYFSDERYIRVNGKPVLLVYRTDIIPDLKNTVEAWRETWRNAGLGEVYLIAVESFKPLPPQQNGFDAAAEFPPHQVNFSAIPPDQAINLIADTHASVGDYVKLRETWLGAARPDYKRFRGLVPSWDNSPRRRKGGATLFVNSSPASYEAWLADSVAQTIEEFEGDERLVFINAWNEWAEGCVLEPSAQWGRAYLEATRNVMQRSEDELLLELSKSEADFASAYKKWLASRPDKFNQPSAHQPARPSAPLWISVVVGNAGGADISATLGSIAAQLRKADLVLTASTDSAWTAELRDTPNSWTLLLAAGDLLEEDALLLLEKTIAQTCSDTTRLVYFDHDELESGGTFANPHLKPDFNHDLLLSYPYMGRSMAVRAGWAHSLLASSRGRFDVVLGYRLALQALDEAGAAGFSHLPTLLAHLTQAEPAVFCTTSDAWQALAGVLTEHLDKTTPGTQLMEGPGPGIFQVMYPLARLPLVSIVIPTRDQLPLLSRCIASLLEKTNYPNFEVLVVDNDSQTQEAREFLAELEQLDPQRFRVLRVPGAFNFSRMNNLAVQSARGEFILMLNNDAAALHPDWLTHMVRHGLRTDVGVVGARLLYPDGAVQHAGVILGLRGPAEHPGLGLKSTESGYLFRAQVQQNFSAVTAACLLVSKALYQSVGGLDETTFGVSYNDVDFCLRVGQSGKRIVWTPLATLLHEGSASQKSSIESIHHHQKVARFSREQASMYERWSRQIANDPAYNPSLSLTKQGYEIETNPLLRHTASAHAAIQRVIVFPADLQGCGHYRVIQPMMTMLDTGLCTGGVSMDIMNPNLVLRSGANSLVFQRSYTDQGLELLKSLSSLGGVKMIYDADDIESRLPVKSAHYAQISKDTRGRVVKAIGLCDRLVVSTPALAHELAKTNDDIRIVLNRLSPSMWGTVPPLRAGPPRNRQSGKPRVGWAGGIGHLGDLEMVADVIKDLADQVDWVFHGMCPDAIRPYVREFYAGVPTLQYAKRLMAQDWDLAIAPLEVNAFNECKSNLKLLEYGWCGVPVICSDVTPYQGQLSATRVKNRYKDWRNAITERIADLDACRRDGLALQEQVASDWMLTGDNLRSWHEAWTA